MRKYWIIVFLMVPALLLAEQWHTTLEVLRPQEQAFPTDIENLLVVNNVVAQPADFGHTTVSNGRTGANASVALNEAPLHLLFALTKTFEDENLFSSVSLLEKTQNTGSFYRLSYLPTATIRQLCETYGADAALVCNRFLAVDKVESFETEQETVFAQLAVYQTQVWTLQYPDGRQEKFNRTDSLFWEGEGLNAAQALAQLPARQTALMDMCAYVGERFAHAFAPQWETVDRYFYASKNADITAGMQAVRRQDFDRAISFFETAYQGKNKKAKAYAAADLAVVYEILGDLNQALAYAQKAATAFAQLSSADAFQQRINLTCYQQALLTRIEEQKRL